MITLPLVSVVIPTYNMMDFLSDAINSILEQTYQNIEIIVVDDGSTDNTKELLNIFGDKISYHYKKNSGPSASRNLGIKLAKGTYIAFLDADDLWLPKKIELQIECAVNNTDIGLVACGYTETDETGQKVHQKVIRKNFPSHKKLIEALSIYQIIPGSSSGVLIAKECFDKVGYFDESLKIGEDWDMWLRIVKQYEAVFVEKSLVVIRKNTSKPAHRTTNNEEISVSRFIEKTVPEEYKNRAYAALYGYLGSLYLSISQKKEAFKYLVKSIAKYPFPIYSGDSKNEYQFFKIQRYYLLIKSTTPDSFIRYLKNYK